MGRGSGCGEEDDGEGKDGLTVHGGYRGPDTLNCWRGCYRVFMFFKSRGEGGVYL